MGVGDFLDALGGTKAVAQAIGVGPSAVSNWRARDAIPPRLHLAFAELAEARAVPFDAHLFREPTSRRPAPNVDCGRPG